MMWVRYFVNLIEQAELEILEAIIDGRIEVETSITDRFLQKIEDIFEKHGNFEGIEMRARTLRDRGADSPEKEFGADFVAVLNINLEYLKEKKGFLAQAKYIKHDTNVPIDRRLRNQVYKMLNISDQSFVFIYHPKGFFVVPYKNY